METAPRLAAVHEQRAPGLNGGVRSRGNRVPHFKPEAGARPASCPQLILGGGRAVRVRVTVHFVDDVGVRARLLHLSLAFQWGRVSCAPPGQPEVNVKRAHKLVHGGG